MDKSIMAKSVGFVGIILILSGGFMYMLLQRNTSSSPIEKTPVVQVTQKLPSQTVKTYADSSGFTFNYPEDVALTKQEINDTITYANLELTSTKAPGKISVNIQDSNVTSIDQWLAKNTQASVSATAKEVKLGDLSAREIKVEDTLVTAALDKGILFTIKIDPQSEKDYWFAVYNTILSSFSFAAPQAAAPASDSGGGNDVFLEEDVVE